MGPIEPDVSRSQRLADEREQQRRVMTSAIVGGVVALIVVVLAITRLGSGGDDTKVQVLGANETSVDPTTTPTSAPTAGPVPTTTTLVIPPGLAGLVTSTTAAPVASTTTTGPAATTTTTAPTTTTRPAVPAIEWSATPSVSAAAGATVGVTVTATNNGTGDGTVSAPGCAAAPRPLAARGVAFAGVCTQGGLDATLHPHEAKQWTVPVTATADGTSSGLPLAAGKYAVSIQGVPGIWIVLVVTG